MLLPHLVVDWKPVLRVRAYWHHASFAGTVDGDKMSGSTHDGRFGLATKS